MMTEFLVLLVLSQEKEEKDNLRSLLLPLQNLHTN